MWFWAAAALAAPWVVDGSSLQLNRGRWPVRASSPCTATDTVLGVAVVVYARKQATMAYGHTSLRTVTCRNGALVDHEYETYRLSAWNEELLLAEHPELDAADLAAERGSLVLFRNVDPVDRGWFAEAQAKNRELYELWLDGTPEALAAIVARAETWYDAQEIVLAAGGDLGDRYRLFSTNCTTVLQRILDVPDPPHVPFVWLRLLEDDARLRVLHPSHALVYRWGTVPEAVEDRLHPLFRRRGALDPTLALPTTPAAPWTIDTAGPMQTLLRD